MNWLLTGDSLIGDLLMQTPAIRALKQQRPDDTIDYLTGSDKGTRCLLEGNPYLTKVRECWNENRGGVNTQLDEQVALTAADYDRTVSLDCSKAFQWGVRHGKTLAEGFGPQLGVEVGGLEYDLVLPEAALAEGRALGERVSGGQRYVVIARHSASCAGNDPACGYVANKCVPNREWVRTAQWLSGQGYVPIAVGAKAEREDERYRDWEGVRVYGEPLPVLAGLLQGSRAVLAVDSGIRHMAAALGCHLYCLSGAIPLSLIRCVPVREGQRLLEEHRPLLYATSRALIAGARAVLGSG